MISNAQFSLIPSIKLIIPFLILYMNESNIKKPWFATWFNSSYYYDLYAYRNAEEATHFIHKLINFLEPIPNSKMLDVGCGRGRHVKTLVEKGFDVTGIDISPDAIKEALTYENDHTHFFVHDMRLPFWINYFDYVFNFFTSFGYFATPREHNNALKTMSQSLKTNGYLIIDYLNVAVAEKNFIAKTEQNINGVHYTIEKYHDETHFYKTILIDDTIKKLQKRYTERVAKFSLVDFIKIFTQNNLTLKETFGNYQLEPYNAEESPRLIMIAVKVN